MAFNYAIALTGSIATGKSSVAKIFSSFGFTIIDADSVAHKILDGQYQAVAQMFGKELIKDNRVDRKALGRIVFADKSKREQLEKLLHPLIFTEIERLSEEEDRLKKPYLVDIPLFFEGRRYPIEKSLVVYTSKETQLKRLMQRDGYNAKDARIRIATQIPIEEKKHLATYVIENNGTLRELQEECERVKEEIVKEFLHDSNKIFG